MERRTTFKSNTHKKKNTTIIVKHLVHSLYEADLLEISLQSLQRRFSEILFFFIFDSKSSRDWHSLRWLSKIFQILAPAKNAVSMPCLTDGIFLGFSLWSFQKAYGNSSISNTSFITSGAKFIFTLKNFCYQLLKISVMNLQELSFSGSSSKKKL